MAVDQRPGGEREAIVGDREGAVAARLDGLSEGVGEWAVDVRQGAPHAVLAVELEADEPPPRKTKVR